MSSNSPHATAAAGGNHNQNDDAISSTAVSPSPPKVVSKVVPPTKPRSSAQRPMLLHPNAAAGLASSAATDPHDISSSSPPRINGSKSYVVGSEEYYAHLAKDPVYSHMKAQYEAKGKAAQAKASSTAAPQGANERNSKEWSLDQTIALLTEVVEGETYIMVRNKKCERL
jgi:hypothetical protein